MVIKDIQYPNANTRGTPSVGR